MTPITDVVYFCVSLLKPGRFWGSSKGSQPLQPIKVMNVFLLGCIFIHWHTSELFLSFSRNVSFRCGSLSQHNENCGLFSSNPNKLFPGELLFFTDMCLLDLFVDKFSFSLLKYQLLWQVLKCVTVALSATHVFLYYTVTAVLDNFSVLSSNGNVTVGILLYFYMA